MPTIKDIARAAGVSHATVSNVLNHKGNVSAKKVKLVLTTAQAMGYQVNQAASSLRSGSAQVIAVILPDTGCSAYDDLYLSLCQVARENGYSVLLRLTSNTAGLEYAAISDVLAARASCAVVVTSLPDPEQRYAPLIQAGIRLMFALRGGPQDCLTAGFDMPRAAQDMAKRIAQDGPFASVALMTNMSLYSSEAEFKDTFVLAEQMQGKRIACVQSISAQYERQAFSLFEEDGPDVVVTTCEEMARAALHAAHILGRSPRIYTLAPLRFMQPDSFIAYQLDYRRLGRLIAAMLIGPAEQLASICGAAPGFAPKMNAPALLQEHQLTLLTANTPVANALARLSPKLRRDTRLSLSITTQSTEQINHTFASPESIARFDLARLDLGLLDRWAKELFVPLEELNIPLSHALKQMLPGLIREYALVGDQHYALPFDPGCHLMFYRKDLFDDPRFQREYYEACGKPLCIPDSLNDFLHICTFFDQALLRDGRTCRGTLITRRASEWISDLFSLSVGNNWPRLTAPMLETTILRRQALERCAGIAQNGQWMDAISRFAHGECALLIAHSNYARHLADEPLSRVSGQVGFSPAPGAQAFLGGGSIGALKFSCAKEEIAVFLQWLLSPEINQLIALLSSCSPWTYAYDRDELLDIYPWLNAVRQGLETGARRSIFISENPTLDRIAAEKRISQICMQTMRGERSMEDAAQAINAMQLYPNPAKQ